MHWLNDTAGNVATFLRQITSGCRRIGQVGSWLVLLVHQSFLMAICCLEKGLRMRALCTNGKERNGGMKRQ